MRKLTRRQVIRGGIGLAGSLLIGDAFFVEPRWIAVRRLTYRVKGLPEAFRGYRIGLFSDVHFPRDISKSHIQRACTMLMEQKPDLVVVTGDFVDGKTVSSVPSLRGLYDALDSAPDGVYGVLGNHDYWLDAEGTRKELANSTPIVLIDDTHVLIERDGEVFALGGIDDLWNGVIDVVTTFEGVAPDVPRILLSHNPDFAEDCRDKVRIDLQLSGHTHGGQLSAPWGWNPLVPSKYGDKFRYGFNRGRSHMCFTTAGICSLRHVRLFCRPEVVVLELVPSES
ncbi:MAG: metallophosphoesterase [Armatimonadetes bacterium]|nr:metallophosphoesterase [Armatimonadota bacterium]